MASGTAGQRARSMEEEEEGAVSVGFIGGGTGGCTRCTGGVKCIIIVK